MPPKTVDEYAASREAWQAEAIGVLRQIVREAAPKASESFKWAQPVYEHNGPFAYIKAFGKGINFGFWRGVDLPDPQGLLEGDGDRMRHVKLTSAKDIQKGAFKDFVKAAVKLNEAKGDPTKGGR